MQIDRRLADFEGVWRLERTIRQADGVTGAFSGQAVFSADGHGALDYVEDGQLTLGAAPAMRATRRYRWADGLHVFFEDGRPFHQVPAKGGRATHLCPPDTYVVDYDFSAWPNWRAKWRVTGPRKDYAMISDYTRAP